MVRRGKPCRQTRHRDLFHCRLDQDRKRRRSVQAQQSIRTEGPPEFRELRLITPEELAEIRRIWLNDKHEFDDSLPRLYEEITGEPYSRQEDDGSGLRADDWALLKEICGDDAALFDLQVALLGVERKYRGLSRRSGVFEVLTERLRLGLYGSVRVTGLTMPEAAQALGISLATAERYWTYARTWLYAELSDSTMAPNTQKSGSP